MASRSLEVCVDGPQGVDACATTTVDRIELCAALDVGGLTPSPGLIDYAGRLAPKIHAMIRPRSGDFNFDEDEIQVMCRDISAMQQAGLAGVVIGVSDGQGALNVKALGTLVEAAGDLDVTLHRVVDTLVDPVSAVDIVAELGIRRILSSGGAPRARDGVDCLARMQQQSAGRVEIMAGSGVTAENLAVIAAKTGIRDFHGSCRTQAQPSAGGDGFGFGGQGKAKTDPGKITDMRKALDSL
ncbi:MAG: copper homeostasis protein CutC [Marinosulfonomonas sp.]